MLSALALNVMSPDALMQHPLLAVVLVFLFLHVGLAVPPTPPDFALVTLSLQYSL